MASNEDYLDELLKSMSSDTVGDSALNRLHSIPEEKPVEVQDMGMGKMDQAMIDALLAGVSSEPVVEEPIPVIEETVPEEAPAPVVEQDMGMGKMDQAMIDALLAGVSAEPEPEEAPAPVVEQDMGMGKMDQAMIDALLAGVSSDPEPEEAPAPVVEEELVEEPESDMEPSSMLAQLMAEMEEEGGDGSNNGLEDDFMSEAGIEALLSAAQNTEDDLYNDQILSFDINDDTDMAEIEALLNMADNDQPMDDNSQLLKLLSEDDKELLKDLDLDGLEVEPAIAELNGNFSLDNLEAEMDLDSLEGDFDLAQFDAELDLEQLESELDNAFGDDSSSAEKKEGKKKGKDKKKKGKEKKKSAEGEDGKKKNIFSKIFSLLMEEVPEEEDEREKGAHVSSENKRILDELDQEEDKKIKVKEKKAKKEKKEKLKKEKKPKKEKPRKEKKPKKEKKVKVPEVSVPEKKIPRKKVIVSFVFAFSILALILLVEILVPPIITVDSAREAYEKGNYYEAYKEYYGLKLSEEDEKKFQSATEIMRMQSNLDGYHNYMKMNNETMAIHSLLEGVHIKFDVFGKAEELGILPQVRAVYDKILEILNSTYHITEEEALELIDEKSDAVYTRKLEAIAEGGEYTETNSEQTNWEDMLPEEEVLFENNGE